MTPPKESMDHVCGSAINAQGSYSAELIMLILRAAMAAVPAHWVQLLGSLEKH